MTDTVFVSAATGEVVDAITETGNVLDSGTVVSSENGKSKKKLII